MTTEERIAIILELSEDEICELILILAELETVPSKADEIATEQRPGALVQSD